VREFITKVKIVELRQINMIWFMWITYLKIKIVF
jgi:hypothetical protein